MGETINDREKKQFRIELALAVLVTAVACSASFSNLLFESNDMFPAAVDFLGHMAKIQYLTESIKEGVLPSAFPYWYCGTALTQYYPPLSYYIIVPIYALTSNVMITFKTFCFIVLFSGGMGVWYYCRAYIGQWCGLFGILMFCFQPYILLTLLHQGQVAQGPVIAMAPWYLILVLSYIKKPTAFKFLLCTVLCALMILSHPNSIFMYCICIMVSLLALLPGKKVTVFKLAHFGLTILFAGVLTAFWSLVEVTNFENPTIPYILGEAVKFFSAKTDWFTDPNYFMHFGIPVSVGSVMAVMLYLFNKQSKRSSNDERYYVLFCIVLTAVSVVFSFGLQIPLFKYIPMAESLVAGRILCLASITGAILCAYILNGLRRLSEKKGNWIKGFNLVICIALAAAAVAGMNPYKFQYKVRGEEHFISIFSTVKTADSNYEKGRYAFFGPLDCSHAYFPFTYGFNMSEGYNIEGTPHNRVIWDQLIAQASGSFDFIAKNYAYWNVRYVRFDEHLDELLISLNKRYPYAIKHNEYPYSFIASNTPSSYFMIDNRDALIFGAGAPGVAIEFPYLVYEQRKSIQDYSLERLEDFKLIYLCEPEIHSLKDKKEIERIVEKLAEKGIVVLIEPAISTGYALFDVSVADVILEDSAIIEMQPESRIDSSIDRIPVVLSMKFGRALFGLDDVYYKLVQNNGRLKNDILGIKKVGDKEVLFIGKHLSQYLKAVFVRNFGDPGEAGFRECPEEVKLLFEDIFTTYGVEKNFWPDPFPVKNAEWSHKSVDFAYSSPEDQEITVSVTYTPRWKATLDGKPIPVGQRENLITLELPSGEHEVRLLYGVTKYGIAGYAISLTGLFILILFIKFYDIIMYRFRQCCISIGKIMQIVDWDRK